MGKKLIINKDISLESLENHYKSSNNAITRTHTQIIMLFREGKSTKEVQEITKYCSKWIYEIVHRFNSLGLDGLGDNRQNNTGRTTLLSQEEQKELEEVLENPPDDGGVWTGPKVAAWIEKKLGRKIYKARGWEYLKKLGYTIKKPRPEHEKSDKQQQELFKKNLKK